LTKKFELFKISTPRSNKTSASSTPSRSTRSKTKAFGMNLLKDIGHAPISVVYNKTIDCHFEVTNESGSPDKSKNEESDDKESDEMEETVLKVTDTILRRVSTGNRLSLSGIL
jgi:hypothetical protein